MSPLLLTLVLMQSQTATGSINGAVIKAGTLLEQSLQNARVELTEGPGTPRIVRSDRNGAFEFSNLSPGAYRLLVTKDRFLRSDRKIVLSRGQQVRNIVFRLEPAPTVTGWVQDEYAEPIANVLVEALRRGYDILGNPTLTLAASALTDDHGQYRIYWIDPGEYYFMAGTALQPGASEASDSPGRGVPPTYFPGVSEPGDAKSVRVEVGREVNGVDFRLREVGMTTVCGYLSNAVTGKAIAATITLTPPRQDPSFTRYRAQSLTPGIPHEGEFTIQNGVTPGSYIAAARSSAGDLSGFARITIRPFRAGPTPPLCAQSSAQPQYDLRLALSPPFTIGGQFFTESTSLPDLRQSRVALVSIDSALPSPPNISPPGDGQFLLTGVTPGTYAFRLSDLPEDFYVKAARFGTEDVLENPMNVLRQPALPLQILIGADGGRLHAAVFDRKDQPAGDIRVVLVPDGSRRRRPDQYRVAMSDESGQVVFRGIPPGDYKLFAWESLEPNAYLNADFVRAYEDFGLGVHINSGDNKPVAIRSIPPEF